MTNQTRLYYYYQQPTNCNQETTMKPIKLDPRIIDQQVAALELNIRTAKMMGAHMPELDLALAEAKELQAGINERRDALPEPVSPWASEYNQQVLGVIPWTR